MEVVYTLERIDCKQQKSIFLAGPCLRDGMTVWRRQAIQLLMESGYDGVVFTPERRNNNIDPEWTYSRQVSWELEHLEKADVILFWVPRSEELPGLTTNIEFGEWLKSGKIMIGAPGDAIKTEYMQERCSRLKIPWHLSLESCVTAAIKRIGHIQNGRVFFTADTHFDQSRVLELSLRPFAGVGEMNWKLIQGWNTQISDNDIVFHLGDFGNPRFIEYLYGKAIYLLPGNYDTAAVISEIVKRDSRVSIIEPNHIIQCGGCDVALVHAPEDAKLTDCFYLFGHIHKLQMIKANGLNVGVDCHNFAPIDESSVLFYKNAVEKHYDHNVFMDKLGRSVDA